MNDNLLTGLFMMSFFSGTGLNKPVTICFVNQEKGFLRTMKFLFTVSCLLCVVNAFCREVKNGVSEKRGYEDDFSQSPSWSSWKSANASGTFSWNRNEGHNGKGALEISLTKGSGGGGSLCYLKHFPAAPGKKYSAVVWIKAKDVSSATEITIAFQGQGADKKFLGTPVISKRVLDLKTGNGWQQIILTFVVPEKGKWSQTAFLLCTIGVNKATQGKIFFDDFYWVESRPADNNRSGEYVNDFSYPDIWSAWKSPMAEGAFSWSKNDGHGGKGAMEISIAGHTPLDSTFCYFKRFPVSVGKTYTVSVWVKAQNLAPLSELIITFQGQGTDKKFLGTPLISNTISSSEIGGGWNERILTFIIPKDGIWGKAVFILCSIGIKKASRGRIFFDDINFFEDTK